MIRKEQLAVLLMAMASLLGAQDTINKANTKPERRHEIGVSVIVPMIFAIGATDYNERYTNLSYRYFIAKNHAVKPFAGISTINNVPDNPRTVSSSNTSTLYFFNHTTTPSNFQVGAGYEYIMGKHKLKQVIGVDIYYNNKFVKESFSYYRQTDSLDLNGHRSLVTTPVDTGAYVRTNNYDKAGLNLSYTLRYEASKRWVLSASTIMTNKMYWKKTPGTPGRSSTYDLNFVGLISDISVFYRF